MDRRDYYYGQLVQEDELDVGFANAEQADFDQNKDAGIVGIVIPRYDVVGGPPTPPGLVDVPSWSPEENLPTPDWNLRVTTGYAYQKEGKRCAVDPPTTVVLDCEEDYLGNPNSVAVGNERWISIFLKFDRSLSDPRVDDYGATVYFVQDESYELEVRQGPEEASPAVTRPALDATDLLLADAIIYNNTPVNGIQDADLDFTRTEFEFNLDLSGILGGSSGRLVARNVQEAIYFLAAQVAAGEPFDTVYLRLDGTNQMAGNIVPDTDLAYSLGGKNRWAGLLIHVINEFPAQAAGYSYRAAQTDWDGAGLPHAGILGGTIMQVTERGIGGTVMQYDDVMGRRHRRYTEDREDFLQPFAWAGTPGTETDWAVILTAGGTYFLNPPTYSQTLAGGHIILQNGAGIDAVEIYRGAYPGRADLDFWIEWGVLLLAIDPNMFIMIGGRDPTTNWTGWVYDPTGLWNPGVPNGNLWVVHDDGVNPPLWQDTLIPMATQIGSYHRYGWSFETDINTGDLYLRFYQDEAMAVEFNLTTLGGYDVTALGLSWDLDLYFIENGGAGSTMAVDYYEIIQRRET